MRVAIDMSIVRQGVSGSARWATGLREALATLSQLEIRELHAPKRRRRGGIVRKLFNAAQERAYYELLLPAAARRWRADVLLMPVNLSARRSAIPQVVTILDVNFLVEPQTYDPMYRRYASVMFARSGRDADVVTTISEYSRRQLETRLGLDPRRVRVVYPGLDPPRASPGPPPIAEPYGLFVGQTEPHKNVATLLRAWESDETPRLRLAIVGRPGRAHDEIKTAARRLGSRVIVTGPVSDDELGHWYRHARVFLFPSLTEGFGYPPLDAMQRGVPVIASNAGALPEVLGSAALLHQPTDHQEVASLVRQLEEDGETRARLTQAGRDRASRFTWAVAAEAMSCALAQAVGQRAS